ncbi:hypothetical protein EL18_03101 [Nitratireductor basaltis]|uniref:Uncharacterized protein n=2 Tax=Nitratireductor basaltis TaxID=472175 RepID=A0A084U7B1_9HYPH|nr:hypothetical protein EL18_03101 [Nitratireductor basaltis]
MALLSELVATCEAQRLDTRGTLSIFARRLREAGRISQAGRGRGAAHMTFLDAARFLIACAATDHPERAADAEFVFSNLVHSGERGMDADFPLTKEEAPTLDLALAKTLEWLGTGKIDAVASARWKEKFPEGPHFPSAFVWLILPRSGAAAQLRVLDGRHSFHHPSLAAVMDSVSGGEPAARNVAEEAFERETRRFRTGKNLTAEFDSKLLRAVANLIAGTEGDK